MDSRKRTLIKALGWQTLGLICMIVVGAIFTGSFMTGGAMALVNMAIGMTCYYGYERLWLNIRWGRLPPSGTGE